MAAPDDESLPDRLVELHGTEAAPTREQWRDFLAGDDDGPVLMVYLVEFRDRASYPDDVEMPERTGAEAFFEAGSSLAQVIADVGGQPALGGFPAMVMADDPDDGPWHYIGAARYPSRRAFVDSWLDPRAVAAGVHRRAGTRRHRLHVTRPLY